jgi:Xaa-Pro aminopeptidase
MLTLSGCRARQQRLLAEMQAQSWDLFLTGDIRAVYYFTGVFAAAGSPTVFFLRGDGTTGLLTSADTPAAADAIVRVETYSIERSIDNPVGDAAVELRDLLNSDSTHPRRCGVQRASTPAVIECVVRELWPDAAIEDAGASLLRLRKRKEPDEVDEIRESLRYCAIAYDRAREIIRPGITELDVHDAMYDAVVQSAGSTIAFPGDFACGARAIRGGGPPQRRKVERGDLYILDLFPAPHFYFGDTCRTFAVGPPAPLQREAWRVVCDAVNLGEDAVRVGTPARDVYSIIKKFLDRYGPGEQSFWHHAGHGIGYDGHESPRIIPGSNDVFEAGDVFTLEPGLYTQQLRGGIRLEDNYLLTEHGLENLFPYPKDLGGEA